MPNHRTKILNLPGDISLAGSLLEILHNEKTSKNHHISLDIQHLQVHASTLSRADGIIREHLQGEYHPLRLTFSGLRWLNQQGGLFGKDNTIQDMLFWRRKEDKEEYILLWTPEDMLILRFSPRQWSVEKRPGNPQPVSLTREWSSPPPMPTGIIPEAAKLHSQFGGDPVSIRIGRRTYHRRLFVGGLDIQPLTRPNVDVVLNLGEVPSRWNGNSLYHPFDRWENQGEGREGMSVEEMTEQAQQVAALLEQGKRVLVHCVAGFNRSVTICCAVLILLEGVSAEDALMRVREHHIWARPDTHHWLQLRWLAQEMAR